MPAMAKMETITPLLWYSKWGPGLLKSLFLGSRCQGSRGGEGHRPGRYRQIHTHTHPYKEKKIYIYIHTHTHTHTYVNLVYLLYTYSYYLSKHGPVGGSAAGRGFVVVCSVIPACGLIGTVGGPLGVVRPVACWCGVVGVPVVGVIRRLPSGRMMVPSVALCPAIAGLHC